jgi:hypothetical protein
MRSYGQVGTVWATSATQRQRYDGWKIMNPALRRACARTEELDGK